MNFRAAINMGLSSTSTKNVFVCGTTETAKIEMSFVVLSCPSNFDEQLGTILELFCSNL
jgi:hypothetical protein